MPIPLDYHIHSNFSEDGDDSLEAMCRQAVSIGIAEIGFSEHWDVGPYEANPRFFKPEPWFGELKRLRCSFERKLLIKAGVEVAEPHLYPNQTAEVLGRVDFDYVLGSVHYVGENFMFDPLYFSQHSADEVYTSYFEELNRMVESAAIDVVAHFDVPARTGKPIFGYNPARYEKLIRAALEVCIQRGLTLDINVAGLRKPANVIMPDPTILNWYAEMGGERVTLGSDAHRLLELGLHLDQALQAIRSAGIRQIVQFSNRHPTFVPL